MNKILTLTGVFVKGSFSSNRSRGENGRSKGSWIIVLVVFSLLMLAGSAGLMAFGMMQAFGSDKVFILAIMASISVSVCLVMSIFRAGPMLFSSRDHDMVMALPVTNFQVIMARLLNLYVFNLLSPALVMLPTAVVFAVLGGSFWQLALYLLAMLFIPMIPMAAGAFVGWGAALVASRFRRAKMIGNLLIALVTLAFSFSGFFAQYIDADKVKTAMDQLMGGYPPVKWLYLGLGGNFFYYLIFAVFSTALIVGLVAVMARGYEKIYESFSAPVYKVGAKGRNISRSKIKALFFREVKKYFSIPIYMLNTGFGMLMILAAAVFIAVLGPEGMDTLLNEPGMGREIARFAPFIVTGGAALSCTTACSISLEGNTLWQLAGLPVSEREIFLAKILLNLAVVAPASIVSSLLLIFALGVDLQMALLMLILPLAFGTMIALFGLAVNLIFPMLDWTSEVTPVKQSLATMIAVFGGMGAFGLCIALGLNLPAGLEASLWMVAAGCALAAFGLWRWLGTKGAKRFRSLIG